MHDLAPWMSVSVWKPFYSHHRGSLSSMNIWGEVEQTGGETMVSSAGQAYWEDIISSDAPAIADKIKLSIV